MIPTTYQSLFSIEMSIDPSKGFQINFRTNVAMLSLAMLACLLSEHAQFNASVGPPSHKLDRVIKDSSGPSHR